MTIEIIKVPDIGGSEGVEVIEICVSVGDEIAQEDSLVVLESDKASMEIPSPMAGIVKAIKISDGDSLSEGDIILELEAEGGNSATEAFSEQEVPAESAESSAAVEPKAEPIETSSATDNTASTAVEIIKVPDIGGSENVDVIEVCVTAGDDIEEGDSLIVLETDKASMEVPAPKAGKVISVSISEGDIVSEGTAIVELETTSQPSAATAVEVTEAVSAPTVVEEPIKASSSPAANSKAAEPKPSNNTAKSNANVYAGPAVRMLSRELGVALGDVKGTGPKGRITKDDLKAFVKQVLAAPAKASTGSAIPAIPDVDFSKFGDVTVESLSKIHKLTAQNMQRNWLNVPHVTQFDDADITELESFRQGLKAEAERRGVKITPLPFILKACAAALRDNPKFNASLSADGENLIFKHYINIGMAVDTPAGLMVPVIKDVDKKSIWDLAAETVALATKAKDRKLMPAEMQGACFTISSLGGIGGQGFTPIVNAPEVAILGISKLTVKPVWDGKEFQPRKMLPLSVSYDHRAINGGDAGRFFTNLTAVLADIRRLVL